MGWENSRFTAAGIALVRRCVDSGKSVRITKAAATDETWPAASLANVTTLAGEVRQELPVTEIYGTEFWKRLHLAVTPVGLTEGYQLRQVGIWGRGDESETPILMFIMQDETGFAIPTAEEMPFFSLTIAAVLEIDDAGDLVIEQECWVQPPDYSVPWWKLRKGTLGYVTPEMFGAKGDGVTDDTAAVQAAVDFAADQTNEVHEVILNRVYYLTEPVKIKGPSDEEHIDINLTISGTGELSCAGINAIDLMYVYNATIRGLSFRGSAKQGDWYTTPQIDEDGTRHEGVINACRCARITVEDCRFFDIDITAAIFFDASEGITVKNCLINRYVYGGIILANKSKRAQIANNKLFNLLACYAGADKTNSYPISVSNSYRTPFELPGEDIVVANNYIWNEKPHWEGIDAHGGKRITITGNIIINCLCGIAMVHGAVLEDITITGNVCRITNDEELDPGSESAGYPYLRANIGIQVSGGTDDDVTYKAKNITVSGNTVRVYGRNFSVQKNNNALALFCGIKIQYAENVAVTGNTISDCGPCGIILNSNVNGCVISGNTIQNLSNPQNALQVVGIYMSGPSTYALATGNHIIAGAVQMLGIRGPATSPGYCVANNNHFVGSNIQYQYVDATHMVGEVFANSPQAMGSLVGKVGDVCKRNPISGRVYGYVCTAPGDGDTTASQWAEMTYSQ